jgi:uncharacterized protein
MIGRKEESTLLQKLATADQSAFVAVYGRRRVGKTYLIRQVFEDQYAFSLTGIAHIGLEAQLVNFYASLIRTYPELEDKPKPLNWFEAFQYLILVLEHRPPGKKILFLDELPWLDQAKGDFLPSLEHFWNSWASARRDVLLIVCGSAATWMIHNLINHRGGLHNRVTHHIHLDPFTLAETEAFLRNKGASFSRYQIIQLYMVLGGVPFYLELIDPSKSATQNINDLCFARRAVLRREFDNLYASLFANATQHIQIIEALAQKASGLERIELLQTAKIKDGGTATKILRELEESSFIRKFPGYGIKSRKVVYQLTDFYSLFFLEFVKHSSDLDTDLWNTSIDDPAIRAWSGYAFELVCLTHLPQIKSALGINGLQTKTSAWIGEVDGQKAQIDLIIDRRDQAINLCEMKFSTTQFDIDKRYAEVLQSKIAVFKSATKTNKALYLTMITTFGVKANSHSGGLVQNDLTMDILF